MNIGAPPPGVTRGKQHLLKEQKGRMSGPSASCQVWRADDLSSPGEDPCLLMGTDPRGGTVVGLLSAEVGGSRGVWHRVRGLRGSWAGAGVPSPSLGPSPLSAALLALKCGSAARPPQVQGEWGPRSPAYVGKMKMLRGLWAVLGRQGPCLQHVSPVATELVPSQLHGAQGSPGFCHGAGILRGFRGPRCHILTPQGDEQC